jgi:SH3-like domain-containing protein
MKLYVVLLLALPFLTSCAPEPEPILDQATVVARNASVRMKNSSTSRTITTLDPGDRVDVLQQQENWYRIKHGRDIEGWMEESTVVTNATKNRIQQLVSASQAQEPQNTAVVREEANFRIEPGRSTPIIRKLEAGTKVEVLERVTKPRPGSETSYDVWIKVRPSPTEVGWVFASLVDFDVPVDVAQYTEGYTYAAVKRINRVEDTLAGPINWYVIGERSPGLNPHLDFDGIRVFTWNMKRHRYETAFRTRGMRGVYPIEVGQDGQYPTFRVYQLSEDGSTKTQRDYVMYGVVVREKKDS